MKQKWNAFLSRTTNYDRLITSCLVTFLVTVLVILGVFVLVVGGFGNLRLTAKFAGIMGVVEHVYIGEADTEAVADAGFSAMIAALDDRWSYYMDAEAYKRYQERSANEYTGIGITLQTGTDGKLEVVNVTADSPAESAGMTVGLVLTHLNGESLAGLTARDVSERLLTMDGKFTLTAVNEQGREQTFTLSLGTVFSDPVSYEMKPGQIGYIHIENFDSGCAAGGKAAVEDLLSQGAEALVFDVRNNGGGYVSELTELLDYLLPEGEIFISVNDKGKEKITRSDADCVELPMAVLVNASSYSAAEYFAAVLREYDAAFVVGQATTGKGRSQINVLLADGSAVHISSKRYLTPNRVDLSETGGLVPDVELEWQEGDNQLAAALELFS